MLNDQSLSLSPTNPKRKHRTPLLLLFAIASGLLGAHSLSAAVLYTDRMAWNAAAGSTPTITEDFDSFLADDQLPVDFGSWSATTNRGNQADSMVDGSPNNAPLTFIRDFVINETPLLLMRLRSFESVTLMFDEPVVAFGFDVNPHPQDTGIGINWIADTNESGSYNLPTFDGTEFRGFIFDEALSTITFSTTSSFAESGWDNFVAYQVPEPSVAGLAGSALLLLLLRRRLAT